MVKYSIKHFGDFYRGLYKLLRVFNGVELPPNLHFYIDRIVSILKEEPLLRLAKKPADEAFTMQDNLYYAYQFKVNYRSETHELVDIFSRLEAMGIATGIDLDRLLALRAKVAGWLQGQTLHGTLWRAGLPKTFQGAVEA